MSDNDENKGNIGFWLGVILGGLIGAAVTYLAAADDKDELKRNLIKKGKILLKNLGEFKEGVEEKGAEIKEDVVGRVEEVREGIQEKAEEIPEVAQEAVEKVQEEANKAIANIVKAADKAEIQAHQKARNFFLSKGRPLAKK